MSPHGPSRRPSRGVLSILLAVLALVSSSCGRTVTLGHEEAIEVMVLDGVDRARATCIVTALAGSLDLEKITGLDVDLAEDELALLAATSSRCAPALAVTGGVVGGSGLSDPSLVADGEGPGDFDVENAVYRMVEEGLDPGLADCLIVELRIFPDPEEIVEDGLRLSELVVDCRDPVG